MSAIATTATTAMIQPDELSSETEVSVATSAMSELMCTHEVWPLPASGGWIRRSRQLRRRSLAMATIWISSVPA